MEKTKEDMLKYAVHMRLRGDTYREMLAYLNRYTTDEAVIKEIISKVDSLEKTKRIKTPERGDSIFSLSVILGILFIVAGIVLIVYLWDKGFIVGLPVLLVIIGFGALRGKMG